MGMTIENFEPEGVLPICTECKKIRLDDDEGIWLSPSENLPGYNYLIDTYDGKLSHTVCSVDCAKKAYELMN